MNDFSEDTELTPPTENTPNETGFKEETTEK